jgi:tripartite-type tricarboxylate transporter receptor subunit TctC
MTGGAMIAAVLLIGATVAPLYAQSYPTKPIRLILPMAPGGAVDLLGRIIGSKLAERLGQPVVCENRPGAGGNLAHEFVAKARPDGYTILLGASTLATAPSLYKKLNYDPVKDLAPISLTAQVDVAVLGRPSLPANNLREFVEYARANPGKLNHGSSGVGSPTHLAGELLKSLAKIDMVHVPYKGAGPAMIGLVGGEVDIHLLSATAALPHIQEGKVRALAVLGKERAPSMANVPTAKEAGFNLVVTLWYGILAPAGTPGHIVNRLNEEWAKIAAIPDTIKKIQNAGLEPLSGTPDQFSEFLKAEITRWGKVVKEAKILPID